MTQVGRSSGTKVLAKTRMCVYISNGGSCRHGSACLFSHDLRELRAPPSLEKTKMCPQLKSGCEDGRLCGGAYAHSRDELRSTQDLFKTSMCKFFSNGHCSMGRHCRFAHGEYELRSPLFPLAFEIDQKATPPPGFQNDDFFSESTPNFFNTFCDEPIIDLEGMGLTVAELRSALEVALQMEAASEQPEMGAFAEAKFLPHLLHENIHSPSTPSSSTVADSQESSEFRMWSTTRRLSLIASQLHERRNSKGGLIDETNNNISRDSVKEELIALLKTLG